MTDKLSDKQRWLDWWIPTLGEEEALRCWAVKEEQQKVIMGCYIAPDITPYQSMATGEMITSRSQHREHLKVHRLNEIGNETAYLERRAKEVQNERAKANEAKLIERVRQATYQRLGS